MIKRFLFTANITSYKPVYLPVGDYRAVNWYRDIVYSSSSKEYLPFVETVRNYVFSEELHEVFCNPEKVSTRFNLMYLLNAIPIARIENENPDIARQIRRNLKIYTTHSAVYNFDEEFNKKVYKELNRVNRVISAGVNSWVRKKNTDRLRYVLENEVYEIEPHNNTDKLVEHLNRINKNLQEANVKDVVSNPLIWAS